MTSWKWIIAGLFGSLLTLSGCVAPTGKACENNSECFKGEHCEIPEGESEGTCVSGPRPDTASNPDGGDDTGVPDPDAGDTQSLDTDPSNDGGMDGGPGDAGDTDAGDADPGIPPTDFYYFTSGGGKGMSSNYDIQVRIGAPSAGLRGESDNYRIQLAPVRP